MSVLSRPYFHNEAEAFAYLERVLWPTGPICPHCGCQGRVYELKGKATRIGLKKCGECRQQFTVKVGTVFEHARLPLHKMLQAVYLMTSSKKGVSAHQLHRVLEVTYKTAWFLAHRIREAMRSGDLAPFGTDGGIVEVDETFIGHDRTVKPRGDKKGRGFAHKHKVLALVDRTTGRTRCMVVDSLKAVDLTPILEANIAREARVMTDEAGQYRYLNRLFASHDFVSHSRGEYGRGEIHTNVVEGSFSIFKRGMKGIYQHCAKKHLHRYVAEFEFRYNNREANGCDDHRRSLQALRGLQGRRLIYSDSSMRAVA